MPNATLKATTSPYENNGIYSIHFSDRGRNDRYLLGEVPLSTMETAVMREEKEGIKQPSNERSEGKGTRYMVKGTLHYGKKIVLHIPYTHPEHAQAMNDGKWDIKKQPNLEPWNNAANDAYWLQAGEGEHPSRHEHVPVSSIRLGKGLSRGAYRHLKGATLSYKTRSQMIPSYELLEEKINAGDKATPLDIYVHTKPKEAAKDNVHSLPLYERMKAGWRNFWGIDGQKKNSPSNEHGDEAASNPHSNAASSHSPNNSLEQKVMHDGGHGSSDALMITDIITNVALIAALTGAKH